MKKSMLIAGVWLVVLGPMSFAEQNSQTIEGKISNVIVYRGQALVTRRIEVEMPAGSSELIISKLPEKIITESLYAQAREGIIISSVRYREKIVEEQERQGVKELNQKIEELQRTIKHTDRDRLHNGNLWTRYDPLWKLTLEGESRDFNRGLLQFEPVKQLTDYLENKFSTLHKEALKLEDELDDLNKQLKELEKEKKELLKGASKVEREALLLVNNQKAGKISFDLNYLVNEASWMPQYNLRAQPDKANVFVEYDAIIHQASGEDWIDVHLNLSTAQPTMEAAPPTLEPMKVDLSAGVAQKSGNYDIEKEVKNKPASGPKPEVKYRSLTEEFKQMQQSRLDNSSRGKAAQRELNSAATSNQMVELMAGKEDIGVLKKEAKEFARTEGVSVTYDLGKGLTMPSKSEQQLVTIAGFNAPADFVMMASPLLTDYVYLEADITNKSDTILLAGPAAMYRNGEFVGKGKVDMVTIGQKFTVGFGVDSQIKIAREFEDKKIDTMWGNRVENYRYRIAIDNYKNSKVKLRLLERIPYTENKDLVIEGFTSNVPLSADADYLRKERPKGLLRWDLELAPMSVEQKATVITYSYTAKYNNDMHISEVGRN
jgi:hypothetical protein